MPAMTRARPSPKATSYGAPQRSQCRMSTANVRLSNCAHVMVQGGASGLGTVSLGTFSSPDTVGFRLRVATRTMSLRCLALAASRPKYALATTREKRLSGVLLVLTRRGHEHGNAANEGLSRKTQHLRTIAENPLHGEGHETVFEVQTVLSDGRAKDASKQAQARSLGTSGTT